MPELDGKGVVECVKSRGGEVSMIVRCGKMKRYSDRCKDDVFTTKKYQRMATRAAFAYIINQDSTSETYSCDSKAKGEARAPSKDSTTTTRSVGR